MIKKIGTWIKGIVKWVFILWLMFDLIAGGVRIILFNNFYNVEQKMTYLYKNYNCGLPQSNYDLIKKYGGDFQDESDTFLTRYTIEINSPKYIYIMDSSFNNTETSNEWDAINKNNHHKYIYDANKKRYDYYINDEPTYKPVKAEVDKGIKRQLDLSLNKIGKKMNYQFKLF